MMQRSALVTISPVIVTNDKQDVGFVTPALPFPGAFRQPTSTTFRMRKGPTRSHTRSAVPETDNLDSFPLAEALRRPHCLRQQLHTKCHDIFGNAASVPWLPMLLPLGNPSDALIPVQKKSTKVCR